MLKKNNVSQNSSGKKTGKVLIVEDDALLLKVLSEVFLDEKIEVITVINGLDVIRVAKEFSPDVILLDLLLPGLDGFAVLKQLKSDTETKNIPIAIISNWDEADDVKSTRALGAEQYFVKANTELKVIVDFAKSKMKSR